jgi:hypothetical protein
MCPFVENFKGTIEVRDEITSETLSRVLEIVGLSYAPYDPNYRLSYRPVPEKSYPGHYVYEIEASWGVPEIE